MTAGSPFDASRTDEIPAQRHQPAPTPTSRPSRLVRLRWPVLCLSLLMVGAGLTYLLVPPAIVSSDQPITVDPAQLSQAQEGVAQAMPSLLGLNKDVAGAALYDAGLGDAKIVTVTRASAGPVDMVLAQKPSPGTGSVIDVELTVSTPAPMPDVMGRNLNDARSSLEALGAVVEVIPRFDPALPKDQVVDLVPKPGEIMPTVVTLTVSDPGDALTLATVEDVGYDSCGTVTSATIAGRQVGHSVECEPGSDPAYMEFAVSRNAAAFEAEIGTDDRGGTGGARVTVFGDGRPLAAADVGLGVSQHVLVPVGDVLRLRIEVVTGEEKERPSVILGDGRLLGLPQGLDAIAAQ